MKLKNIIVCLLAQSSLGFAQTSQVQEPPPLPPGPPITKVEKGTWSVVITEGKPVEKAPTQAPSGHEGRPSQPPPPVENWTISKYGKILNMTGSDFMGPFVRWVIPEGQFIKRAGTDLFILDSTQLPTGEFVSYTGSDFPECQWVNRSDYKGVQSLDGKTSFYVFENKQQVSHPYGSVEPPGSMMCYVDQTTRLPVKMVKNGRTFTYSYNLNSTPQLKLPKEIEAFVEAMKKRVQELQRRNGRA